MSTDLELVRIAKRLEERGEADLVASVEEVVAMELTSKVPIAKKFPVGSKIIGSDRWNRKQKGKVVGYGTVQGGLLGLYIHDGKKKHLVASLGAKHSK